MLGQYRIISEILIFALGLAIATFVVITFSGLRDSISEISTQDQMNSISNLISTSLIKAMDDGTIIRVRIPDTISGEVYTMTFQRVNDDPCILGDCILKLSTVETGITTTQQLFNISQTHIINGNVFSTSRYIEIRTVGNQITVRRA